MEKFFVIGGNDTHWQPVSATTLVGAKTAASKMYQSTVGGEMRVAVIDQRDHFSDNFYTVAVKYGHDNWQNV